MKQIKAQTTVGKKKGMQTIVIAALTLGVILLISLSVFMFKSYSGDAIAGQALYQDYEDFATSSTVAGDWGFGITKVTAGTFGSVGEQVEGKVGEEILIPVFLNFGTPQDLLMVKLEFDYTVGVLEPITVISYLGSAYGAPPGENDYVFDNGKGTLYYVFGGNDPAAGNFQGQKKVFDLKFKVVAPEPGQNEDVPYTNVVSLTSVPEVITDANVDLGFYGVNNVQLVNPDASPIYVNVDVIPPCYDGDGDDFGDEDTDQRACKKSGDDCDDAVNAVNLDASETCNGVDDDCVGGIDDNLPLEFNQVLDGFNQLDGVCLGYKVCVDGVPKNSYEVTDLYTEGADACDFYDNDCDGLLNEDNPDCPVSPVGTTSGAAFEVGNVYIEPLLDEDQAITGVNPNPIQLVDGNDRTALYVLSKEYEDENNKPKCYPDFLIGGLYLCHCKSGEYYLSGAGYNHKLDFTEKDYIEDPTLSVVGDVLQKDGAELECS
jgi:hypothetical protein